MATRITKRTSEAYELRTRAGEWARIYLEEGQHPSGDRFGSISVLSSFGNFGNTFPNIGPRSFKEFLAGVDYDYLMQKFLGETFEVFDPDATAKAIRDMAELARDNGEIEPIEEAEIVDALEEVEEEGYKTADLFLMALEHRVAKHFHPLELWLAVCMKRNPQAVGFWDEIWLRFVSSLKDEIERESR